MKSNSPLAFLLFFAHLSVGGIEAAAAKIGTAPGQSQTMTVVPVQLPIVDDAGGAEAYYNADIPRTIHQIWFGDPALFDAERSDTWQTTARQFDYKYHLWTEDDDEKIAALWGRDIAEYIAELRAKKHFSAASDVLRYFVVEHFGGMYFDLDIRAPSKEGKPIDPASAWPLRGLILPSENDIRAIGNSAFYLENHLIMASPHHPVMQALIAGIRANRATQRTAIEDWSFGPIFITGQALLSRTVQGTFTMLPINFLKSLDMDGWPDKDYSKRLRERYARETEKPSHIHCIH